MSRLSIEVSPEQHQRLKAIAALHGQTIKDIGPGRSGTSRAMEENPEDAEEILARRREQLRRNMELTTQGIKSLAEVGS